ncbi:MAG: cell division FtsA domain-containing protein [Candidatus Aenigmatarchaeota archaeon]
MKNFYFGLDLGHYECKFTILEELPDNRLISYNNSVRNGFLKKGEVLDIENFFNILEKLLWEISESFGISRLNNINVSFSSPFFQSSLQKGYSIFEKNLTEEDIKRAIRIAKASVILTNQVNLVEEPVKYIIDGTQEVRDPIGLSGRRLDAEVFLINVHKALIDKLSKIFEDLKIKVNHFLPSLYPASKVCLSKKDKDVGVALMDIGAQTITVGIFIEGKLINYKVFDIGCDAITEELAIHFKMDLEEAENLKREILDKQSDKIKIKKKKGISINKFIEKKLKEIFIEKNIVDYLKEIKKNYKLPAGMVVIGGGSKIVNLDHIFKNLVNMQVKYPKDELNLFENDEDLLKYSNSAGSALISMQEYEEEGFFEKIKNLFFRPFSGFYNF